MAQTTLIYRFKNLIPEQTTPRHIIIKLFKNKGNNVSLFLPQKKDTLYTGEKEYK